MSGKNKKKHTPAKRKSKKNNKFKTMPDVMNVSLIYVARSQVSGTSFSLYNFDGLTLHVFQPTYRDQLLTIYNQYVVFGVTVQAKIVNRSTSVDVEVLDYFGDGYTVSGLTFNQALEYKHTQRHLLSTSGNQKVYNFERTIFFKNFLPPKYWDDSRFWGSATAGPAYSTDRGFQHAIGFIAADGTSSISVTMDRRITFHTRFFTLAAITNSLDTSARPVLMNEQEDDEPEMLPRKGAIKKK